jgi:hypothetical protein
LAPINTSLPATKRASHYRPQLLARFLDESVTEFTEHFGKPPDKLEIDELRRAPASRAVGGIAC